MIEIWVDFFNKEIGEIVNWVNYFLLKINIIWLILDSVEIVQFQNCMCVLVFILDYLYVYLE